MQGEGGGGVEKIACVKKHGYADSTDLPNIYRISTRFLHDLFYIYLWTFEKVSNWLTDELVKTLFPLATLCVGCFYEF